MPSYPDVQLSAAPPPRLQAPAQVLVAPAILRRRSHVASSPERRSQRNFWTPRLPKPITLPKAEPAKPIGLGTLIDEARELRAAVRGMFARSKNLIAALQQQRRKAQIVDSTLASLKKLQNKVQP